MELKTERHITVLIHRTPPPGIPRAVPVHPPPKAYNRGRKCTEEGKDDQGYGEVSVQGEI